MDRNEEMDKVLKQTLQRVLWLKNKKYVLL